METGRLLLSENSMGGGDVPDNVVLRGEELTLGRGQSTQIIFSSLQISRRHATLKFVNNQWHIVDHSTNGMSINNKKLIKNVPTPLNHNDLIYFVPTGQLTYKFLKTDIQTVESESDSLLSLDNAPVLDVDDGSDSVVAVSIENKAEKRKSIEEECSQKRIRLDSVDLDDDDTDLTKEQLMVKNKKLEAQIQALRMEKLMDNEEREQRKSQEVAVVNEEYRTNLLSQITTTLETELSCCICTSVFICPTVTDCGHTFCNYCITEWTKKKAECPICRKLLRNPTKHVEMDNYITKLYSVIGGDAKAKREQQVEERSKETPRRVNQDLFFNPIQFDLLAELQLQQQREQQRGQRRRAARPRTRAATATRRGPAQPVQALPPPGGLPGGFPMNMFFNAAANNFRFNPMDVLMID